MENLYTVNNGACPYLENREWKTKTFIAYQMNGSDYEELIDSGFRRSGIAFYKNCCDGCNECIPLRVPVNNFEITDSQKRSIKKDSDVEILLSKATLTKEGYELYKKYCIMQHSKDNPTMDEYYSFLIDSPVDTYMMYYKVLDTVIGIGWIDILGDSISSVYFAYDPDYKKRSLGVFSIIQEIELCKKLRRSYLQLGFGVIGCKKMSYKYNYRPLQELQNGMWSFV